MIDHPFSSRNIRRWADRFTRWAWAAEIIDTLEIDQEFARRKAIRMQSDPRSQFEPFKERRLGS